MLLENVLGDSGFTDIRRYSDFEEGFEDEADFYTCVAQV
jgi:hypothetical protein